MRKLKLLLAACALLGSAVTAWAQTNLVAGWDGGTNTTSPSNFGWTSSANRTLNARNATGGIRMTTNYSGYTLENGTSYSYSASSDPSSVIFWVRYNTSGESFTYTFQGLEPNYYYDFSALVGWHNNSSSPTFTIVLNDGTNTLATMSKNISTKQKMYSVSSRFKAPSTITSDTDIKLVFTCNKASNEDCMEAISALKLVNVVIKEDLNKVISYATQVNTKISNSSLTSAIATAQGVYDNSSATQAQVNEAESTLRTAINTAIAATELDPEGEDVSAFIYQAGFEGLTAETGNYKTANGIDYASEGWTLTQTGGFGFGAAFEYNANGQINDATIPAQDNASGTGKALGISVGWGTSQIYQSEPVQLLAGSYTLKIYSYNAGTATDMTSKFGVIPTTGTPTMSTKTSFATGEWESDEISFTLDAATEVRFQVGGAAGNNTSTNHGKVFFDNLTLTYFDPLKLAQIQWQGVHDALDALDETALPDAAENAITTELAKTMPTSIEDCETAKAALQALIDSYDDIKTAYDKALDLIDFVTDEKTNSTGTKTTIDAAISTATTNIETRTNVEDLTSDYNTLETARQTYVTSGAQPTADHVFDMTFKISDATVTGSGNWSNKGTANGQQYTGAPDNKYMDCGWNSTFQSSQTVSDLPAGYYTLKAATRAMTSEITAANIYANQTRSELNQSTDTHRDGNTGGTLGNGWSWTEVNFELRATGDVSVGFYAQTTGHGWAGADDFHLYYKGNAVDDETANTLKETVVSGKMNATVASTQSSAMSAFESAQTIENYEALEVAISAASASVTAYTKLKTNLDKIPAVVSTTNVYSASAYATNYTDVLASYNDNSISTDDADSYDFGSRVTGAMPAIMLSSWKVGETAALTDASLYMNTWSTEGNSDGSNVTTPFYEYWVADANALSEKIFTATVEGLSTSTNYQVSVLVRVRQQDSQTKADDDVTIQVSGGDAVNAADGTQSTVNTSMFYKTVYAKGTTDGEGKLTITITVKDGNHINWLAFKNVRYTEDLTPTDAHKTALENAIAAAEGKAMGFDEDEYAPYNNKEALVLLANAKAIDYEVNTDAEVVAATTALTEADWNQNETEVNAVSSELFNGVEYGTAGWTRSVGWNNVGGDASYSIPAGTMTYGTGAYHEMPLKGNTVYKLIVGHRRWDSGNADNGGTVSVLNESSEGLAATSYSGTSSETLQNEQFFFRTGADDANYIFSISAASGRLTFGNVSIMKAVASTTTISEDDNAVPAYDYANVTLTRTLSKDYWNTFSVPFDMAIPEGWTVKEFDSATDNVISFKNATTIVAGKPYLVKPTANVVNPTYNGVIVQNTEGTKDGEGDYKFAAQIYNKDLATDGTIAYLATDGTVKKLTSGSIKGLRAYFIIPAGASGARIAFIDGDETTGISEMKSLPVSNDTIYDLNGRRVQNMGKGIYVVNGKKVVK